MKKKLLCILILITMLLPVTVCCESVKPENGTVSYTYSFFPGNAITGAGSSDIKELMDTLKFRMIRQIGEKEDIYRLSLLSKEKEVFHITAQDSADGDYSLMCSLMGDHIFLCRKSQITEVILTFVQVLSDLKVLKGESLDKVNAIAGKAGSFLEQLSYTTNSSSADGAIDIMPYIDRVKNLASEINEYDIREDNEEYPTAVKKTEIILSENDMNNLVNSILNRLCTIPVIGDTLKEGKLQIGKQVITDAFIRKLFSQVHGPTVLDIFTDADDKVVLISLYWPDLSAFIDDPVFAGLKGICISINRYALENNELISDTRFDLIGGEKLLDIRLNKQHAQPIKKLPNKKVHDIGLMNSEQLWKTIKDMGLIIISNALDLVLNLPSCVFNALVGSIFH